MNRYRTIPSLSQPKASTTTTCQKCLKKDNYECKSTTQERPYISRPSRTQQFLNPKLKPKLASDQGNGLMRSQGVADQELARAQAARETAQQNNENRRSRSPEQEVTSRRRQRSISTSSINSVSTISTSRSRSPYSERRASPNPAAHSQDQNRPSRSISRSRKRKHRESSFSGSPPRLESSHKNRRYRNDSPDDRGRPTDFRRGSTRDRSREGSVNRSEVTKQRRSLDQVYSGDERDGARPPQRLEHRERRPTPPRRKERSLSPYSRRLALTQAMNMGR